MWRMEYGKKVMLFKALEFILQDQKGYENEDENDLLLFSVLEYSSQT